MACGGDGEKMGSRGDELERGFEFGHSGEAIAHAGDEERRALEVGEVLGAELLRLPRWVERIGEEQDGAGTRVGSAAARMEAMRPP